MSFFKRKPKPDIMGFICFETTKQRIQCVEELLGSSDLNVRVYAFSTGVIQNILDIQYTQEIIDKTIAHCDQFMFKKYKEYKDQRDFILELRQQIQQVDLNDENQINGLVEKTMAFWQVNKKELQEILSTWCSTQLLISNDIKSK